MSLKISLAQKKFQFINEFVHKIIFALLFENLYKEIIFFIKIFVTDYELGFTTPYFITIMMSNNKYTF